MEENIHPPSLSAEYTYGSIYALRQSKWQLHITFLVHIILLELIESHLTDKV